MSTELLSDNSHHFLKSGATKYALPRDSAELYRNNATYQSIWGDDIFFVIAKPDQPFDERGSGFVFTGDLDFTLADTVAYNHKKISDGAASGNMAHAMFLDYATQNPGKYPTYMQVREQRDAGLGYYRLSGGAFIIIDHDTGDDLQRYLPLFRRTFNPNVLTDGNGMVAEADTAAKEALEEWGLVGIDSEGACTVYAVDFCAPSLPADAYVDFKRTQESVLRANLADIGITPSILNWERAHIEEVKPLIEHTYTLHDAAGDIVDRLTGIAGYEKDFYTFIYRRAGIWHPPATCRKIAIVDPEMDRKGALLTPCQFQAEVAKGPKNIFASTAEIGNRLLNALPPPRRPSGKVTPIMQDHHTKATPAS